MPTSALKVLPFTGDADADRLLVEDPLALLIGMVLDQQITIEKAFRGPLDLQRRLGHLDPRRIAGMDPAKLEKVFKTPPALHRFPGSMARRVRATCALVATEYQGDAARIWRDAPDAATLARRLRAIPGIGEEKTRTLISILAKRLSVRPAGWEREGAQRLSLGDVDSPQMLARYRDAKRLWKAEASASPKR